MAKSTDGLTTEETTAGLDAAASNPESWLAEAAAAPAIAFGPPRGGLRPGTKVGEHYEIRDVLGTGGMGIVYRAQDQRLDRPVALKLHHAVDERSRDRLLREAKVMAKLSHPNVLAVHEVGTWHDHVFLAAELVEGMTVQAWQRKPRPWQEVVRLYIAAGEGLAAAHEIGLVHRDFKPANVLVGDDGRVRVADFGLARPVGTADGEALQQSLSGSSSAGGSGSADWSNVTRTGATLGTPAYMAPEQLMGEELDGRADQFAFSVSLYEGLFGQRPFAGNRPTAVAAAIGRGPLRAPGNRRVPRRLWKAVARGLRPEPADRFASMSLLLAELRRALRPRRIWAWAGAAAGLGLVVLAWPRGELGPQCDSAGVAMEETWSADRKASLAGKFQADPNGAAEWQAVEPEAERYATVWIEQREAMCRDRGGMTEGLADRGYACLDGARREFDAALAAQEESARARVRALSSFGGLVQPHECRDASLLMAAVPPPSNIQARPKIAELQAELAKMRAGARVVVPVSDVMARLEAIAAESTQLDYAPLTAEVALTKGAILAGAEESPDAVRTFEDAYFLARAAGEHRLSTSAARQLGEVVGIVLGRNEAGRLWARIAITEAELGSVPLAERVQAQTTLAVLLDEAGEWDEADRLYRDALAQLERDPQANTFVRANILSSLAGLEGIRGRVDQALAAGEESMAIYAQTYGGDHLSMNGPLTNIGFALAEAGRYAEAYEFHTRALKIIESALGTDSRERAATLINLGVVAEGMGDAALARAHYEEADRLTVASFGPKHPDVALIALNLSLIAEQAGQVDEAARLRKKAVDVFEATRGPLAPETLRARTQLAQSNRESGNLDEACPEFDAVVLVTRREQGESRTLVEALWGQGECALQQGNADAAVESLQEALRVAAEVGAQPRARAGIGLVLAEALWSVQPRRATEARAAATEARALYEQVPGQDWVASAQAWLDEHPAP